MAPRTVRSTVGGLLPAPDPVRFVAEDGTSVKQPTGYQLPADKLLSEAYRRMVLGRRFDTQATALTKQGRLAVYPSSRGQEACQIGGVLALREDDWLFPTYRDSVALVARGIDPVEVLTLLRGDWHCGYDPMAERVAPQCTPLATQLLHAAGMAHALRTRGDDSVVMAFVGDGGTSEGDFHEAVNFAAVFNAPVVFFVQNNKYAIRCRWPGRAQHRHSLIRASATAYGPSRSTATTWSPCYRCSARRSITPDPANGPSLVEAHTYRMEAHTNADDASRYRDDDEVAAWLSAGIRWPGWRPTCADRGLLDDDGGLGGRTRRPRRTPPTCGPG